jgi:antitoxin MazE
MLIKVVQIGNSQGIRIPKAIIEQCEIGDEVEATIEGKKIILSAKKKVRDGWADLFEDEPLEEG